MPELEEAGERATGQVTRSQNVVYTLPHATESIREFLTPALGRIDPATGGTQVVVVTRDAETACVGRGLSGHPRRPPGQACPAPSSR